MIFYYISITILTTFVIVFTLINWRFYRYPILLVLLGMFVSGLSLLIKDFLQVLQTLHVANFDDLSKMIEYSFLAAGGGVIASAIVLIAEQSYKKTQNEFHKGKKLAQDRLNDCYQTIEQLKSSKAEFDEKTYYEKLGTTIELCMHYNSELKQAQNDLQKLSFNSGHL